MNSSRERTRQWVDALAALQRGEGDIQCPQCDAGRMQLEDIFSNGVLVEQRIYCDVDSSHENFARIGAGDSAGDFVAIVCGLKSEAKAVRNACSASALPDDAVRINVSGASAARAEEIARQFCAKSAIAVLSVGVSGGLDPALAPGDLIVTDNVLTTDGPIAVVDKSLLANIMKIESAQAGALIYGSDVIIQSAEEKAALFARSGAVAVDMESHVVARAAAEAGVPFLAIRAIADPADRALPAAAMNAVAPDGSTRVFKTLWEAAKAPKQFPALMKLGADSDIALKTLRASLPTVLRSVMATAL
ncbi:MAG: hypothetical protein AAGJ87_10790 [Pseudomonadota bacterium]